MNLISFLQPIFIFMLLMPLTQSYYIDKLWYIVSWWEYKCVSMWSFVRCIVARGWIYRDHKGGTQGRADHKSSSLGTIGVAAQGADITWRSHDMREACTHNRPLWREATGHRQVPLKRVFSVGCSWGVCPETYLHNKLCRKVNYGVAVDAELGPIKPT